MNKETLIIAAFVVTSAVGLAYIAVSAALKEQPHNCVVVEHMPSTVVTSMGVSSNGAVIPVISAVPGQTAWRCDDGVIYWR